VPAQDRDGQQGERALAAEHHRGPGDPDAVRVAQALDQPGATGHHQGGGYSGRTRPGSFGQRADHGQDRRDAGHRHADDGRLGVP
jgi:hypothetical protein